eukprot:COSAG05_NODE_2957_length_2466_cov_2.106886_5_plen_29_part_01
MRLLVDLEQLMDPDSEYAPKLPFTGFDIH